MKTKIGDRLELNNEHIAKLVVIVQSDPDENGLVVVRAEHMVSLFAVDPDDLSEVAA